MIPHLEGQGKRAGTASRRSAYQSRSCASPSATATGRSSGGTAWRISAAAEGSSSHGRSSSWVSTTGIRSWTGRIEALAAVVQDRIAGGPVPLRPKASHVENWFPGHSEEKLLFRSIPLPKAGRGNHAPTAYNAVPKQRLLGGGLRPGVDHQRPRRSIAPGHKLRRHAAFSGQKHGGFGSRTDLAWLPRAHTVFWSIISAIR